MARPREFDRTVALRRAMELFWERGYEATSVHDLGVHLGLQPGSLYNTFKDKHSLFLEALDCYSEHEHAVACSFLAEPYTGLAAIERFFLMVVDTHLSDPAYKGCLMVNSAAELVSRDSEVHARVEASRAFMAEQFRTRLAQGQQMGEVDPQRDLDELALFLVNSLFGLQITAKILRDRQALTAIVAATMRALR